MQPAGAVPLSQHNTETRHNDISLLWPERENHEFILEFSGLYHYRLREGRKLKNSEKTPDDLFIISLLEGVSVFVCHLKQKCINKTHSHAFGQTSNLLTQ
jgi:hypothetical protein